MEQHEIDRAARAIRDAADADQIPIRGTVTAHQTDAGRLSYQPAERLRQIAAALRGTAPASPDTEAEALEIIAGALEDLALRGAR
jgi:hypothetical protein